MADPYAQCYHPTGFIAEELHARNWTLDMMFDAMMQHYGEGREKLELMFCMYFEVGPTTKNMRMGDTIADLLHQVFGTSKQFWLNIESAWLADESQPHKLEPTDG
jgi:hypothetical protein